MEKLQRETRIPPYWDALWVKDSASLDEIQDTHPSSVYCDRRTGELKRSDWFKGQETLNIQNNFYQDSLHFRLVKSPLKACTVNVHAHWVQQEEGVTNLSSSIRLAFPHFHVNTYTKDAFSKRWPEPGQRLGRSGLWVVKSELKETDPPSLFYPRYSPVIPLGKEGEFRPHRIKRYWFKPTLWVGWQYQQKRKETLSLTLHHAFQSLYPGEGEHKVVEYTLQNINPDPNAYPWRPECFYRDGTKVFYKNALYRCNTTHTAGVSFEGEREKWDFRNTFHTPLGNPARASFFLTDRGYLAAEHAMERAKAILAKSARAIEISFEAHWDVVKDITTDTSVILADSRLPDGEVRGKVVSYALIAKGETGERSGRVTLLCSVGLGVMETNSQKGMGIVVDEAYCAEDYQVCEKALCQTSSGLSYFRYDDQGPPEKERSSLLRMIEVMNGPDVQEEEILSHRNRDAEDLRKALLHKSSRLRFHFKDLRTRERVEHTISVTMASPWGGPQQITLF